MTVERILSEKKNAEVVTVEPGHTLNQVARLLAERRIGAVVVSDAARSVLGILSERDIVRVLATDGPAALDEPVSRFMTAEVATCRRASTINDVMETMTNGRFRHVPVVEHDRLVGIVSIGDVVKQRLAEVEAEHQAMREYIATA